MKGKLGLLLALMLVLVVVLACGKSTQTATDEELEQLRNTRFLKMSDRVNRNHLAWCDKTYHQNIVCPKHGMVKIPTKILAKQASEFQDWCDLNYHQNVTCPLYGQVIIPPEVVAKQLTAYYDWCNSINHQNVGCPGFDSTLAE